MSNVANVQEASSADNYLPRNKIRYNCVICGSESEVSEKLKHLYVIEKCCSLYCLRRKIKARCVEEVYITVNSQ